MALESGTFINDLVSTNPAAGDLVSQGDDHIRLIKSVLQSTFPSLASAVDLTPTGATRLGTIELGHATDTTLARASAGNLSIEGNIVYRAGGTDVPVTDGGTGASTAAAARTNLAAAGTGDANTFTQIQTISRMGTLLTFNTDRTWQFETSGTDSLTTLDLRTLTASKTFNIKDSDGTVAFAVASGSGITALRNPLSVALGGTAASTAAAARTNLGLGTIATQSAASVSITGGSISGITDLAVADGGTGASTASAARSNLGLSDFATTSFSSTVSVTGSWTFTVNSVNIGSYSATGASDGKVFAVLQGWSLDSSRNTTSNASHHRFFNPNGGVGSINTSASATSFNTSSDEVLKNNVVNAAVENVRTIIKSGRPVEFEWREEPGVKHLGFIAQEMYTIHPDAVTPGDENMPWMMDHSKLVPVLWAALQDALVRIEALEAGIGG
jgi:hypothetical protein